MPKINNRAVLIHTAFFKVVLSKSRANPFPLLWRSACHAEASFRLISHALLFSLIPPSLPPLQRLRGIYKSISLPPVPEQATNARQYNNKAKEKKIKERNKKENEKREKKKHRCECVVSHRLRKIACNPRGGEKKKLKSQ